MNSHSDRQQSNQPGPESQWTESQWTDPQQAERRWSDIVAIVERLTAQVGHRVLQDFGQVQATEKSDGSLVTRSDQWADQELRQALLQSFPEHGVLSEEGTHQFPETDWCWIIDPIDGTTNFTRGIPLWGISLGLLYKGTPVFGHVYLPTLNYAFHGIWIGESGLPGHSGAFLNHRPIQASTAAPGSNQFFNLCARSTRVLAQSPDFPCKIRMLGVASYNLLTVASGAALGGVEATPKIWDIAAVWAIVQAAGAVWHALDEQPIFPLQPGQDYGRRAYPTLVASRPELLSLFLPRVAFLAS